MTRDWPLVFGAVLLTTSTAVAVLQFQEMGSLRQRIKVLNSFEPRPKGSHVPKIILGDGRNTPRVEFPLPGDRPSVLYWTSPTCAWSDYNEPLFRALVKAKQSEYNFVAVVRRPEEFALYRERFKPPYRLFGPPTEDARLAYSLFATPLTVAVSRDGVVRGTWVGAYTGDTLPHIESFFGVHLAADREPGSADEGGLSVDR